MQLLSKATTLPPTPNVCAERLLDTLPCVMWFVRRQMRSRRTKGLSVPQFRTMAMLSKCDSASLSAVAENLGCSMPTASRLVTGLVGKGLIQRRGCRDDRRQVSLQLTSRGHAALASAWTGTQATLAQKLSQFCPDDCSTLVEALRLLADTFGSTMPPGEPLPDETAASA